MNCGLCIAVAFTECLATEVIHINDIISPSWSSNWVVHLGWMATYVKETESSARQKNTKRQVTTVEIVFLLNVYSYKKMTPCHFFVAADILSFKKMDKALILNQFLSFEKPVFCFLNNDLHVVVFGTHGRAFLP